jgi:hypothetical protein
LFDIGNPLSSLNFCGWVNSGRSRVRFSMRSIEFPVELILQAPTISLGSIQRLTVISTRIILDLKGGRQMAEADNHHCYL